MIAVSRTEWGAQHGQGDLIGPVSTVVVHHTAGAPVADDPVIEGLYVREVEADHRSRGWAGIGYNWVIFPSGRVFEGRGWRRKGAHARQANGTSVGVAFHMHGSRERPTDAAVAAFRGLVAEGVRAGHLVEPVQVTGHRDYVATECPGTILYAMLPGLLDEPPADPPPPDIRIPREELPGPGWFPALRGLILTLMGRR
jgi:hypothetical protein